MRPLIVLISLTACAKASAPPNPAPLCYALEWGDSTWASLLPRSARFDTGRDTLMPVNYNYLSLKPVNQRDTVGWTHLMNAWWTQGRGDSMLIMLDGVDSGWRAHVHRFGDSLSGMATYSAVNDQQAPMPVRGRRFACPEVL